jgi:hypothetical protein
MKINSKFVKVLTLLAALLLVACTQSDEKFKSYSIGFTTQGQEVSVDAAYIDNHWSVPGGVSITGIWGEASGGASVFDKAMPHEIYVKWEENASKLRYEATVKLADDLTQRARKLPPVLFDSDQSKVNRIYIIIGLARDGKVTTWLTNAPYASGITGRVLEVIGEAQGKITSKLQLSNPAKATNS